jgi:queuine tRNA-ribosyltransferase
MFMPVGTRGAVKALSMGDLRDPIDAKIILGNTYHLYLKPGTDIISEAGGLHRFIGWDRPMLTDSGGYQVHSLSDMRKITEEGVTFRSHIDGSKHMFSPESAMDIQKKLGADIVMAFDECTSYPVSPEYSLQAMHRTHRWLDRCIAAFDGKTEYGYEQTLAGIVQGSVFPDQRRKSSEYVATCDLPINAIGGLSVGEPHHLMYEMTEVCCDILPTQKPRYLMGVGTPANVIECIALGVDMFDCVLPTRNARHGIIYTWEGEMNMKNAKWKNDHSPIDPKSKSPQSRIHSRAYLRHLLHTGEMLGAHIASVHNLAFYLEMVGEARKQILNGTFLKWKEEVVQKLTRRL